MNSCLYTAQGFLICEKKTEHFSEAINTDKKFQIDDCFGDCSYQSCDKRDPKNTQCIIKCEKCKTDACATDCTSSKCPTKSTARITLKPGNILVNNPNSRTLLYENPNYQSADYQQVLKNKTKCLVNNYTEAVNQLS
jgi:hypothetical protein